MKKLFTDRARLVIYLERDEFDEMTANARRCGQTLIEWAREILRFAAQTLEIPTTRPKKAPRGSQAPGDVRQVEQPVPAASRTACPHHKQRGELCYKCDPKFGLPQIT